MIRQGPGSDPSAVLFAGAALWGLHMGLTQGLLAALVALLELAASYRAEPELFQSLVVLFEGGAPAYEPGTLDALIAKRKNTRLLDAPLPEPKAPQ